MAEASAASAPASTASSRAAPSEPRKTAPGPLTSSTPAPTAITAAAAARRDRTASASSSSGPLAGRGPSPAAASTSADSGDSARDADAEDFFKRAQAMGLRLTREDYERTRAGVTAFLKAKRAPTGNEGAKGNDEGAGASSTVDSVRKLAATGSRGSPAPTAGPSSAGHAFGRQLSGPSLSFFTAVVPSQEDHAGAKPRLSLEELMLLEERRRRRARRRRLREKAEQQAQLLQAQNDGDENAVELLTSTMAAAEAVITSPEMDALGTSPLWTPSSGRLSDPRSGSSGREVGLGFDVVSPQSATDSPAHRQQLPKRRHSNTQSPCVSVSQSAPTSLVSTFPGQPASPGLSRLSRRAIVSPGGTLRLAGSPAASHGSPCGSHASPGAPEGADDSGCFVDPLPEAEDKLPHSNSWARQRQNSAASSSATGLHEGMNKLSFLDKVMAGKTSPVRLRKEAKARAQVEEEQARCTEAEARAAGLLAPPTIREPTAEIPADEQDQQSTQDDDESRQPKTPEELLDDVDVANPPTDDEAPTGLLHSRQRSMRWLQDMALSPHVRMSTRDHYDFMLNGVSPLRDHLQEAYGLDITGTNGSGGIGLSWEATLLAQEAGLTGSASRLSHTLDTPSHFGAASQLNTQTGSTIRLIPPHPVHGSPLAGRSGSIAPFSPGVLSLDLAFGESTSRLSHQLPARRGLLFGPFDGATDASTPPMASTPTTAARQDPMLVGTPLRRASIPTASNTPLGASPPKLIRASTFAAPALRMPASPGDADMASPDGSPVRLGGLGRSNSASTHLELSRRAATREHVILGSSSSGSDTLMRNAHEDDEAKDEGAQTNAFGRYETISPAALFGFMAGPSASQQRGTGLEDTAVVPPEPTKASSKSRSKSTLGAAAGVAPIAKAGKSQRSGGAGSSRDAKAKKSSASNAGSQASSPELGGPSKARPLPSTSAGSGSSLAAALGVGSDTDTPSAKVAAAKGKQSAAQTPAQASKPVIKPPSSAGPGRYEWDKPDGSRVVKLVSDELQAALNAGTLDEEPPARYYRLPPGWGKSASKPTSVSYAGLIGQAILSSYDGRLSLNEIYTWISTVHPFFEKGDRGWQNSIRHNLSLNKSFAKVEREAHIPGKGGWWAIKPGHEERFRDGVYIAGPVKPGGEKGSATKERGSKAVSSTPAGKPGSSMEGSTLSPAMASADGAPSESSRKRVPSDGSPVKTLEGDARRNKMPKSKSAKKIRLSKEADDEAQAGSQLSSADAEGRAPLALVEAPRQATVQARGKPEHPAPAASEHALTHASLHQFAVTPHRPAMLMMASSGHGSTATSAVPGLIDDVASSPMSSPMMTMMPPPSIPDQHMGLSGAYGTGSNRRKPLSQQGGPLQQPDFTGGLGSLGSAMGFSAGGYGLGVTASGQMYSSHLLQGSPLASMQPRVRPRGMTAQQAQQLQLQPHSMDSTANQDEATSAMSISGSPLRRTVPLTSRGSPGRPIGITSPISSLRAGVGANNGTSSERSTTSNKTSNSSSSRGGLGGPAGLFGRSPARATASPAKGSPLRPGGALLGAAAQRRAALSPAGVNLQLALRGEGNGSGSTPTKGASGPTTSNSMLTPASAAQLARWGMSPSPMRRFAHANGVSTPGRNGGAGGNWLDDPFDYGGTLQHEFQLAEMVGGLRGVNASLGGLSSSAASAGAGGGAGEIGSNDLDAGASPLKMMAWANLNHHPANAGIAQIQAQGSAAASSSRDEEASRPGNAHA